MVVGLFLLAEWFEVAWKLSENSLLFGKSGREELREGKSSFLAWQEVGK